MPDRPATPAELAAARSFPVLVSQLEDGDVAADLDTQYRNLVTGMRDLHHKDGTEQKGKIVLTVDFKLGSDGIFLLMGKVKVDAPLPKRRRTIMHATDSNVLTRVDPRQSEMFANGPVRRVEPLPSEVKPV